MRKGDKVVITNGLGNLQQAEITVADPRETQLTALSDASFTPKEIFSIHMAVAPTRHPDRLEWFIEKATETGVDAITLMVCYHSEKWKVKQQRLERLLIAAMKQSQRAWLPVLSGPLPFSDVILAATESDKYIAWCEGNPKALAELAQKGKSVMIAIGPEGDFSADEVTFAQNNGFHPISLGPHRLRTETAALLACHTIHVINAL